MHPLSLALLILAVLYAVTMLRFAAGFRRVVLRAHQSDDTPFVSIIIPARNEAAKIGRCVRTVLGSDYPAHRMEIIVVDDDSTDGTADAACAAAAAGTARHTPAPVRVIRARQQGGLHGKKAALTTGIEASRGEIILTTDADCRVARSWVRRMIGAFESGTGYVAGPVVYSGRGGVVGAIQALEFLGLVAVGAGAIGNGRPILSNGANAAFRRTAFDAVGGYAATSGIGPGDDDMLMQRIAYVTPWEVAFCAHPGALVHTDPPENLRAFVQQRLRWGSTAPHYRHGMILPLLVCIYAFYVVLVAAALATPFVPGAAGALAAGLLLKVGSEATLLSRAVGRFGKSDWMRWFLPAQLLHIPYVILFPAAGTALGYRWKGRRLRR